MASLTGARLPSFLYISLQRQNGPGQRVIREVNTTTRACALWGLAEDSDYTVQLQPMTHCACPGPVCTFENPLGDLMTYVACMSTTSAANAGLLSASCS
ncbi:fibronectin type III domain-containing protein 5-like isoform X2 [Grammomys surdaster]|uniref:fibronectin type III domain-containing protein 5-like isoform X2 n=1 Tax=Grammomys surdaster TaxID=491861 RepID=UPI0010A05CB6|nr:fibronectin type III domain-containing protein 5-like isoform X2 [Grammomys surdaster]